MVMVKVSSDNRIEIFIDGDNGVKIQDCIDLSRKLEACLDREEEDFELSVLSWGLGEPLKMKTIESVEFKDEEVKTTKVLI